MQQHNFQFLRKPSKGRIFITQPVVINNAADFGPGSITQLVFLQQQAEQQPCAQRTLDTASRYVRLAFNIVYGAHNFRKAHFIGSQYFRRYFNTGIICYSVAQIFYFKAFFLNPFAQSSGAQPGFYQFFKLCQQIMFIQKFYPQAFIQKIYPPAAGIVQILIAVYRSHFVGYMHRTQAGYRHFFIFKITDTHTGNPIYTALP